MGPTLPGCAVAVAPEYLLLGLAPAVRSSRW